MFFLELLGSCNFHRTVAPQSGASIPIYRWRKMRHGQFWGGNEKSILGGMKKFNIKSVDFVHKFNN